MFDIGWSELLVIGIVALIVVGPKDLPIMFRKAGQFVGRIRAMASEFTRAMDEAADSTGVNELKESFREATSFEGTGFDEISNTMRDYSDKVNNLNPATQVKKAVLGTDDASGSKSSDKKAPAKKAEAKKAPAKKAAAKKAPAKKPAKKAS